MHLQNQDGLSLPELKEFPGFICEACTVRSVLDRELTLSAKDLMLLMLEHIRFIDMVHAWARSTHKQYQQKLALVRRFGDQFEVPVLVPTLLERPPGGPDISLMWI